MKIVRTTGAVVGKIMRVKPHPNASHTFLADVDLGTGDPPVQIVFGGCRRLLAGDLVPVAQPGARIFPQDSDKPKKMRARKYRGQRSHGMLCSLDELGWLEGGPDEVPALRHLKPGYRLDELPEVDRPRVVKNWYRAVEIALQPWIDAIVGDEYEQGATG